MIFLNKTGMSQSRREREATTRCLELSLPLPWPRRFIRLALEGATASMEFLFEHDRRYFSAEEQSACRQTEPAPVFSLEGEQAIGAASEREAELAEDEEEFEEELIIEDFTIDGICGVY
jgi:mycofactocin precursor